MSNSTTPVQQRTLIGVVVKAAGLKTRLVEVTRRKRHPKYGKTYQVSRRLAAHDEHNAFRVNDTVELQATRPLSKTKRWRIIRKVS